MTDNLQKIIDTLEFLKKLELKHQELLLQLNIACNIASPFTTNQPAWLTSDVFKNQLMPILCRLQQGSFEFKTFVTTALGEYISERVVHDRWYSDMYSRNSQEQVLSNTFYEDSNSDRHQSPTPSEAVINDIPAQRRATAIAHQSTQQAPHEVVEYSFDVYEEPRRDASTYVTSDQTTRQAPHTDVACSLTAYNKQRSDASRFLRCLLANGLNPSLNPIKSTCRFENYNFQDWWAILYHYIPMMKTNPTPRATSYILSVRNYIENVHSYNGCAISQLLSDYHEF